MTAFALRSAPAIARPVARGAEEQAAPAIEGGEQFARLYEAHVDRIHAHLLARVGDAALADDLTAAVYLRAWQARGRYRPVPGRPVIAWLFTIGNNLVVDHYRRHKREVVGVKGEPRDGGRADPERCALNSDLQHELRRAMSRLKPEQQLVVSLRLIDGLDYGEIAAITGKSAGALRVSLCRALAALRTELDRRGVRP
jgi:RNA polymerase sigma-70 factor (ECF subfamily)